MPDTTALRYISQLVNCALVERKGDTTDHRRVFQHIPSKANLDAARLILASQGGGSGAELRTGNV